MFTDNLLALATAQSLANISTSTTSMFTYDVTGAGIGVAPNMVGGINASTGAALVIGDDIGAGDGPVIPEVYWNVSTAFATGSNTSLAFALQAAPDNGSNAPGNWTTLVQTSNIPLAQLTTAGNGQFQIPPVPPGFGEAQPRFYRLNFIINSSTFAAGAITANIVLNPQQSTKIQLYPGNFVA